MFLTPVEILLFDMLLLITLFKDYAWIEIALLDNCFETKRIVIDICVRIY